MSLSSLGVHVHFEYVILVSHRDRIVLLGRLTFVASVLRKCWCVYCVLQEEEEEEEEGGLEQTESSEEVVKKAEEEDNKLIDSSPRADSPSQEDHIEKGQLEQVGDWEEGDEGQTVPILYPSLLIIEQIVNIWYILLSMSPYLLILSD